jgi:hypothetical protein
MSSEAAHETKSESGGSALSSKAAAAADADLKPYDEDKQLECRYYENEYPEIDEVVMVNVTEIADLGAYVTLLEYDKEASPRMPPPHRYSVHLVCRANLSRASL